MEAKLVIVSGKTNKSDVKLRLPTVIGRSREADLTIAHPMISRRHCQLFEADGFVKIKDLGSLNGTFVYGKRIDQEVLLRPNDEFTIGPLTFRVEYEAPSGLPEPPPGAPEETPEYIPSFFASPTEPEPAGSEAPEPAEAPAEEPAPAEAAEQPPTSPESPSPWEDIDALEKEFDFDLAEDLQTEQPSETQEGVSDSENLAEAAPFDEAEESLPTEEEAASEVSPHAEVESSPKSEPTVAAAPSEKSPAQADEGPSSTDQPQPASAAAPSEEEQSLDDDLDEIEDAALRDFLKGLH